jgi:hypothetical protein
MLPIANLRKQSGAALIVGLVLMVLITALAISGMNTATTELALARSDQIHEYAFQAAETGLEDILASDSLTRSIVPDKAYSLGTGSGIAAYHFIGTATATSRRDPDGTTNRDAEAVHSQAFYIVGPEPPAL